ncbi:sensor histidine kinase [Halostreptopolyspora alba]|uniref:histidine kinase n=1 Tax=Halostreptopolyspora alba TaxID=2487137 RepID=A0A3N0E6I9_9ACTN|nr:sensor histidine kinase [Nocardiopsaceae bacterium YIM 96095]
MPETPSTPIQAAATRRFLTGGWPWRSAGYLLTTPVTAAVAVGPLAALAGPWAGVAALVLTGAPSDAWTHPALLALLIATGALLFSGGGPLVTLPLAALERRRLRLVDSRPIDSGHRRPPRPGLGAWVRTRYTESATWRELVYVLLLASVLALTALAVLTLAGTVAFMIVSPLILVNEPGPIALLVAQVGTPKEALPFMVVGVAMVPVCGYTFALLAGVHGALARRLLGRGHEELRDELVEVTRSRSRLVDLFEAERHRIERDLHDGAQQRLVTLTMRLGLARLDLPAGSSAATQLAEAHDQAKQLMAELRELIHGIHPQVLTDLGLPGALPGLAERCPVPVTVSTDIPRRLPAHIESTAYFVVAEALANVAKHSGAANAKVNARVDGVLLVVEVGDDGDGGAAPENGTGLTGLADRVAVMSGRMEMSSPNGGPTLLRVELPCDPNSP